MFVKMVFISFFFLFPLTLMWTKIWKIQKKIMRCCWNQMKKKNKEKTQIYRNHTWTTINYHCKHLSWTYVQHLTAITPINSTRRETEASEAPFQTKKSTFNKRKAETRTKTSRSEAKHIKIKINILEKESRN